MLGDDQFVSLPGRHLRMMVAGSGDDLVVLEAGLGVSGLYWGPVHQLIAHGVRVVAYERAGFGASTPDRHRRDLARLASDLEHIVAAVPHRRLVLVGHSWGGPIVRTTAAGLLASEHPVAGLVLVDQSDEHAADLYCSRAARWSDAVQRASMVPLARWRLLAPLTSLMVKELPQPLRNAVVAASTSIGAAEASAAELVHVADDLRRLSESCPRLDGVNVSVISGAKTSWVDAKLRGRLVAAHQETARAHPGARHVFAQQSGHLVPLTEPELIAAEALAVFG